MYFGNVNYLLNMLYILLIRMPRCSGEKSVCTGSRILGKTTSKCYQVILFCGVIRIYWLTMFLCYIPTLSYETVMAKYNLHWIEYMQIQSAYVNAKSKLQEGDIVHYEKIQKQKKKVRYIYNQLIVQESRENFDKLFKKMSKVIPFTMEQYAEAFKRIYTTTNITKYRDFQYRLLVGAIFVNDRLYYWGKVGSQKCELCACTKQTVQHVLFDCPKAENVRKRLCEHINECYGNQICKYETTSYSNVFLGIVHTGRTHIINFLFLILKQYLFSQKI